MAQPTEYNRRFSFTNFAALNPTTPPPGGEIDDELNLVKLTTDEIRTNLALIQRDDGALANGSVGRDQLKPEVTVGFNVPTTWVTAISYTAADTVFYSAAFYRCVTSHTSGVFSTDLAAGKWALIADLSSIPLTSAAQIAVTPTGGIAATNVQSALAEIDAEKALLSHTHPATGISDSTSTGRSLMTAASTAAVLSLLGITDASPVVGELRHMAVLSTPARWLPCDGSAVSRTTYSTLFSAITISATGSRTNGSPIITGLADTSKMAVGMPVSGTGIPGNTTTILSIDSAAQITLSVNATSTGTATIIVAPHGVGDGSTTFSVPDYRGRVLATRDNLGGVTASRITSAGSGVSGVRLGASGGAETVTLSVAQIPSHDHGGATGGRNLTHTHTYTTVSAFAQVVTSPGSTTRSDVWAGTATATSSTESTDHSHTIAAQGGGGSHNNLGPTAIVNTFIYAGV